MSEYLVEGPDHEPYSDAHEWRCPSCGAVTRARMADAAEPTGDVRDALAAQETVRRVEALAEDMESAPRGEIMPVSGAAVLIRHALAGES